MRTSLIAQAPRGEKRIRMITFADSWGKALCTSFAQHHEYVTRGLDPRVHLFRETLLRKKMDCRVKPGNDD
jgi:hypothetical protein